MDFIGTRLIARKYLVPLILALSVLFVSRGISVPNFTCAQEAKLSKLQGAHPAACDIVKSQVKSSSHTRVVTAAQFYARCAYVGVTKIPVLHLSVANYGLYSCAVVLNPAIPSRAPPA
jgi:hypothetical protein